MTFYAITWDIEIDADSPREAALKALEIQRDPNSTATVFSVYTEGGDFVQIDTLADDDSDDDDYDGDDDSDA